jgi:hypothetical protein
MLGVTQAGPQIGIHTRAGGGWCAPARTVCPPLRACPKVITFAFPTYYYPAYYGYAATPTVVSTSFSNVSPVFDNGETGIYRVPVPIISPPPLVVPEGTTFGWRR